MKGWERIFEIDFRSLRLFRFGLGTYAILDLLIRLGNFSAFHTESGVLPAQLIGETAFSLFLISTSSWWAAFLFVCIAICGALLILNTYPRLTSLAAFILALSLRNRNDLIIYGGDDLFRVALLWSALLPSGPSRQGEASFSSLASAGALLQLVILYLSAGLSKRPEHWLHSPNATFVALSSDTYAKPITRLILDHKSFLTFSAVSVFYIERFAWLAFFSPWWSAYFRLAAFVIFAGMHLSFGLFLHLELFPLIDITLLCLILPGKFWDWLKVAPPPLVEGPPRFEPWLQPFTLTFAILIFYATLATSPEFNSKPLRPVRKSLESLGLYQSWNMFAPIDGMTDNYYRVIGRTPAGQMSDEILQTTIDSFPTKPVDPQLEMGGFRWTRYFETVSAHDNELLNQGLLNYFCRKWDPGVPGSKKREISFYQFKETTLIPELPVVGTMKTVYSGICPD
jgi:hypothetical protein